MTDFYPLNQPYGLMKKMLALAPARRGRQYTILEVKVRLEPSA